MKNPFSFEEFLYILEHDDCFHVDETSFYFIDDPSETEHMLGYLPQYEKPYWIGYCDIPDGCEYDNALELLTAKVYDGKSMKERWDYIDFSTIGALGLDDWMQYHRDELILIHK